VRLVDVAGGLAPGVSVYTGTSLGALTTVSSGETSASFPAVAGTTYRIAVDGTGGSTGTFKFEYSLGECNGLDATIMGRGSITGTTGDDVIVGSSATDVINGRAGNDTICGFGGDDDISGAAGNDRQDGGTGNDTFKEGPTPSGADRFAGEAGFDTVTYGSRTGAVRVTVNGAANDGESAEGDNVTTSVERVFGGSGGDTLTGNDSDNTLLGQGGGDTIRGGGLNDTLVGGLGPDSLFGEAGADALNLVDGVNGNDNGDGGPDTDRANQDTGDTVINVP